jgi:hypothetical protein
MLTKRNLAAFSICIAQCESEEVLLLAFGPDTQIGIVEKNPLGMHRHIALSFHMSTLIELTGGFASDIVVRIGCVLDVQNHLTFSNDNLPA